VPPLLLPVRVLERKKRQVIHPDLPLVHPSSPWHRREPLLAASKVTDVPTVMYSGDCAIYSGRHPAKTISRLLDLGMVIAVGLPTAR
jgi:hypothetical protein